MYPAPPVTRMRMISFPVFPRYERAGVSVGRPCRDPSGHAEARKSHPPYRVGGALGAFPEQFVSEVRDRSLQPNGHRYLRFPTENVLGKRDVGSSLSGIVA